MLNQKLKNFFLPIYKRHKLLFILIGIEGFISGIVGVFMPLLLKFETDQLVEKKSLEFLNIHFEAFSIFLIILFVILIVKILDNIINSIIRIFISSREDYFENDIQLELFKHMENMEVGKTMNSRFQHFSYLVRDEFKDFAKSILNLPSEIISNIIKGVGITAVYAYFDIKLLFVVLASTIVSYYIDIYKRNLTKKYDIKWEFRLGRKIYQYSHLFLSEFIQLATNGAIKSSVRSYKGILDEQVKNGLQKNYVDFIYSTFGLINSSLTDIIIKAIVGFGVFYSGASVGMVVLVVSSMGVLSGIIRSIFDFKQGIWEFQFRQKTILLFLKMCKSVGSKKNSKNINKVEIKNLFFSYPNIASYDLEYLEILKNYLSKGVKKSKTRLDDDIKKLIETIEEEKKIENQSVLNDLSISFEKGKIYGIVGKNGAGKTTLMHIISGFFRSYNGELLFDNDNSKKWEQNAFAEKISFLTQVPFILGWDSTIKENIILGVNESKNINEQIWNYLEIFGIKNKIKKHKKGLDAIIGKDIDFSGGEKQLIAIIRVLIQNRQILILDEGTNQLDAENEVIVMKELLKQKKDKIIIFITHRMSTISKADIIYCLEDGNIKSCGNHKELLNTGNNIYSKFYKTQVMHENLE